MNSSHIRFFRQYLSSRVLPIWTILLGDMFLIVLSTLIAYCLRYGFANFMEKSIAMDSVILWSVAANLIFFRVFRTYSNVLRFSSFVDIMRIFAALTSAYLLLIVLSVLFDSFWGKK